jgi:hypothetical protein
MKNELVVNQLDLLIIMWVHAGHVFGSGVKALARRDPTANIAIYVTRLQLSVQSRSDRDSRKQRRC